MRLFSLSLAMTGRAFAGVEDPAFWEGIAGKVPEVNGTMLMIAAFVMDLLMRYVKTEKPISILRMIAVSLAGIAKVFDKAAKLLDAVLGQRAAKPADPAVPPAQG